MIGRRMAQLLGSLGSSLELTEEFDSEFLREIVSVRC